MSSAKKTAQSQLVVARHGASAWLVLLCAIMLSFLSIYALTLGSIANSTARDWQQTINASATLNIPTTRANADAAAAAAQSVLSTTQGIVSFNQIDDTAKAKLLEPWLGNTVPLDLIDLPVLFNVVIEPTVFDQDAVELRLSAEIPAAKWDNHQRWRGGLLDGANRLSLISWVSTGLIAVTFLLLMFIAVLASIYANAGNIALLRQIGASDKWILSGFIRKFVTRVVAGSVIGVILGSIATMLIFNNLGEAQLASASLMRNNWAHAIVVIVVAAAFGYAATYLATNHYLRKSV